MLNGRVLLLLDNGVVMTASGASMQMHRAAALSKLLRPHAPLISGISTVASKLVLKPTDPRCGQHKPVSSAAEDAKVMATAVEVTPFTVQYSMVDSQGCCRFLMENYYLLDVKPFNTVCS